MKDISIKIGFAYILGIVFIILKLINIIDWSWIWVLAPFWISCGIRLIVSLIIIITIDYFN